MTGSRSKTVRIIEIAELLGVSKQRAHQIAEEKGFPAPLAEDARGRVRTWSWGSPKTVGSERTIDLPRVAITPLAEHLLAFPPLIDQEDPQLEGLVFYGERGGHPVRRHAFRKIWARACTQAGVEGVRVEWLRHSGASLAYAATKDIKATSARLGHTSTRMIDTVYLKLYDEVGRQVADAIDELVRASLTRETDH